MSLAESHFLNAQHSGAMHREPYNESEGQEMVSQLVFSTQIQTTNNISMEQNHEQGMTRKVFHLQKGKRISKGAHKINFGFRLSPDNVE